MPRQYRPPPGMCRIWIDSVPPNRQPEATDCPTALRRRPPNARVIFGDDVSRPRGDERVKQLRPNDERREKPQDEKEKERGKQRVPALFGKPRGH